MVLQIPNGLWQILGKSRSAGRAPWRGLRRVIGRRTVQSLGRKQVGRLVANWIATHAEDIAALGIVRQSRIWRAEPSGIYIVQIKAIANLMPTQKDSQNTTLISRHASPSSNRISRSLHGFVRRSPQGDYMDCSTALYGIFCFSFQQILATRSRRFHSEIIGCLKSQNAVRGHHQTSAH